MLEHKHIARLDNPHFMTEQVHWYWHKLRDKQLTVKQTNLLKKLAYMPVKQQREYVIIDDELIKTPTKHTNYTKTAGKWCESVKK